jgi:hypothetical protein
MPAAITAGLVAAIVVIAVILVAVVKASTRFHGTMLVLFGLLAITFSLIETSEPVTLVQVAEAITYAALYTVIIIWGVMLIAKDAQNKVTCIQGIRLAEEKRYRVVVLGCLGMIVLTRG